MCRRIFSLVLCLGLIFQQTGFAQAATAELNIGAYFSQMSAGLLRDYFRPAHIRFFSFDVLRDDLRFMLDKGDLKELPGDQLSIISQELLNYFLTGISLPNDTFWVNLRPDSQDSIIEPELARTDVGKIMLETDLQLKKDTSRFTSPHTPEGKEYWNKLYKKAEELYGFQQVDISTLNRPWIVPNEIIVRETKDSAYIYKATLKVMLEQDHLSGDRAQGTGYSAYEFKDPRAKALNEYSAQLMRKLIIPKLTKEVNLSKNYASLRQVYYSIIFSRWFKSRFSNATGKYASRIDTKDLSSLTSKKPWSKSTYYNEYKKSFAQGEYSISEPVTTPTGQVIRTYFSGGADFTFGATAMNGARLNGGPFERTLGRAGLVSGSSSSPVSASSPVGVSPKILVLSNMVSLLSGPQTGGYNIGNAFSEGANGAIFNHSEARSRLEHKIENMLELIAKQRNQKISHDSIYSTWTNTLKTTGLSNKQIEDLKDFFGHFLLPTPKHDKRRIEDAARDLVNIIINEQLKDLIVKSQGRTVGQTVLCVGETEAQYEAKRTETVIKHDLYTMLRGISAEDAKRVNLRIAYEPRWAIGTGLVPTNQEIVDTHFHISDTASKILGTILEVDYGGSLSGKNAREILSLPRVDGGLIGTAAKTTEAIVPVINAAIELNQEKGRVLNIGLNWKAENPSTGLAEVEAFVPLFQKTDLSKVRIVISTPQVSMVRHAMQPINNAEWVRQIDSIQASEILDSRLSPTVKAIIRLKGNVVATAAVPSGASTGEREALELRDGQYIKDIEQGKRPDLTPEQIRRLGKMLGNEAITKAELYAQLKSRFSGKGVLIAVDNVNSIIAPAIKDFDVTEQRRIDEKLIALDGSEFKQNLGANAILSVSLAVARAAARQKGLQLYEYIAELMNRTPTIPLIRMFNVINGGEHAGWNLDLQEFMIVPFGLGVAAKTFRQRLEIFVNVFNALKKLLKETGQGVGVGDEGGFAPKLNSNEAALSLVTQAIEKAGYKPGVDVGFALDPAASQFFDKNTGKYVLKVDNRELTPAEMVEYYADLARRYPIFSIEDGMAEGDEEGWKLITQAAKTWENAATQALGITGIQIVGDDLFVTNTKIFKQGITEGLANAILIKVNQIGTLTETLDAISMAEENSYAAVISHRSGETDDDAIADIVVGTGVGQIKTGASRGERIAKDNRILAIEERMLAAASSPITIEVTAEERRLASERERIKERITADLNTKFDQRFKNNDPSVVDEIVEYNSKLSTDERQALYEWLQFHESRLTADAIAKIGFNWLGIVSKLVAKCQGLVKGNPRAAARQLWEIVLESTYAGLDLGSDIPPRFANELKFQAGRAWDAHPEFKQLLAYRGLPAFPQLQAERPGVLVLVRHGETVRSEAVLNKWAGWQDTQITELGTQRGFAAGQRIGNVVAFDQAYTSDLSRAKDTLTQVLQAIQQTRIPVIVREEIRERDYGDMIGWRRSLVQQVFGEEVYLRWRRGYSGNAERPAGGENLKDVQERSLPVFLGEIMAGVAQGQNIIVSAHGNSLRSMLIALREHTRGQPLTEEEIRKFEVALTTPIVIVFDNQLQHKELWVDAERGPQDVAAFLEDAKETAASPAAQSSSPMTEAQIADTVLDYPEYKEGKSRIEGKSSDTQSGQVSEVIRGIQQVQHAIITWFAIGRPNSKLGQPIPASIDESLKPLSELIAIPSDSSSKRPTPKLDLDSIVSQLNKLDESLRELAGRPVQTDSASLPLKPGGIDFRDKAMQINYEPLGNFSGLDLRLPILRQSELNSFDIEKEIVQIERMVDGQVLPSGQRIKELLAACRQKGEFSRMQERIMVLLVKMGILEEKNCCLEASSKEYREALVLAE